MSTESTTIEVVIAGKDAFSATAAKVTGGIKAMESAAGRTGSALSSLSGRLGHAKSAIGGLLTGPLGILGLSAGILGLAGAIEHGITKAADFGLEVYKLQKLTGMSADTVSALASAFEHFGLSSDTTIRSIGMLEKNVGLLASRKGALEDFRKTFGFALTDSSGHLKDANALILSAADYFNNKLIPAQTKAAALAKLFGRSWQELIPILAVGSKGILDAEAAAKDLGLTLSQANVDDLAKFKDSTRELGTAIGGLELQIGLALIPTIKDMADTLTQFVRNNRQGIVQFFKDAAVNVQKFGHFIAHDVLPPLEAFGSAASKAWNAVPDPLKQILIGGVIANKTGKFLFDFGLGDAANLLKSGAGGLGGLVGRGSSPANAVWVQSVGGIGGGGGAAGIGIGGAAAALGVTVALQGVANSTIPNGANPYNLPTKQSGFGPQLLDIDALAAKRNGGGQNQPDYSGSWDTHSETRSIELASIAAVKANTDALQRMRAEAQRVADHLKATQDVGGDKAGRHKFLSLFRGNDIGVTIKDFPAELRYLSSTSDAQKKTAVFTRGVKENIAILKRDLVRATDSQKVKLSADIRALQRLLAAPKPIVINNTTSIILNGRRIQQVIQSTNAYGQITPGHNPASGPIAQ